MSETRVSYLTLVACALGYIGIAVYLEAGGGPQRPDKILWLDVKALAYTEYLENGTNIDHFGKIRQAPRGADGAPWQGGFPAPVRACGIHTEGQWDQPSSPWYCPEGQSGVDNPWMVGSPPPLTPCRPSNFLDSLNGYICTRGATYYPSGAGYYWTPRSSR